MKKTFFYASIAITILSISLISCNTNKTKTEHQIHTTNIIEVDQYVEGIMERIGIPGAAVAIIKDGKTIHENYYGYANIEHQVPIRSETIFPLLSTTKIPVITAVFKLIEENKITLNDEIGKYVDDIPEPWKSIEIKYLLAHSSGLPDVRNYDKVDEETMKKMVYKDPFEFEKGEIWRYNQTNFWILARIIEKVTGNTFESHLLKSQFKEGNPSILFSTNMLDIVKNRALRYTPLNDRGKIEIDKQINGTHLNSANGLNISLPEFINWNKRFEQGEIISENSKVKMWEKFNFTKDDFEFAYGWEIHNTNNHFSYGFSGGYTTAFRTYPQDNLTIIWLTNGFEKDYSTDSVINYIAGIVDTKLQDTKAIAIEKTSQLFHKNNVENALTGYQKLKKEYPNVDFSKTLDFIASDYLNDNKTEKSIAVYDLLVAEYSENWIGYYGRGNVYKKLKDYPKAILDYQKSAELNENESDKAILKKMAKNLEENLKNN